MRYPVTDEFAIAFGDVLYRQLLSNRQPVDVAVARAVATAVGPGVSAAYPAVSVATPGIFAAGPGAAGLRLDVPRGRPAMDPAEQRMAYFPDEPPRFVGRADAMAQASAALASGSGKTAVLLHGMAGAGKTACALELAYRHQDAFAAAAYWQAPRERRCGERPGPTSPTGWTSSWPITGLRWPPTSAPRPHWRRSPPACEASWPPPAYCSSSTTWRPCSPSRGAWRDPRWQLLIGALTGHDGESRVTLTSRVASCQPDGAVCLASRARRTAIRARCAASVAPGLAAAVSPLPQLARHRVLTLPVHALSLGEAAALARELPNLRALLHADAGTRSEATPAVDADRERILRVLRASCRATPS